MITASARFAQIRRASAQRPHGTRARYVGARCRCLKCRAANSRYNTERDRAQRDGEYNGLVDASKARLAAWMGYSSPAIQFKRGNPITAESAAKVRRMFELINAGKLRRAA